MGSVIKADLLGSPRPRDVYVVNSDTFSASNQGSPNAHLSPLDAAAAIVREGEAKASSLLAQARLDAANIRSAAHDEGYDAGLHELDAERMALQEKLSEIQSSVDERIEEYYASMEPELLKLAVDIARQVIRREVEENSDFVLGTIKVGLRQLRERSEIRIRVNPGDYEFTREHRDEITQSCDGVRSVEIVDDRRVNTGGCIIESPNGELDARIDTQIGEIERALMEAVHDGRNDVGSESE